MSHSPLQYGSATLRCDYLAAQIAIHKFYVPDGGTYCQRAILISLRQRSQSSCTIIICTLLPTFHPGGFSAPTYPLSREPASCTNQPSSSYSVVPSRRARTARRFCSNLAMVVLKIKMPVPLVLALVLPILFGQR